MTGDGGFIVPEGAMPTNVSLPIEQLCHYITDDQLRRLGEMRKDLVMEICLAAVGIFFGSLVPAISGIIHFNQPDGATGSDLLSMVVCMCAFAVGLITGYQWWIRQKDHVDLVDEIRNRPRVRVVQTPGTPSEA